MKEIIIKVSIDKNQIGSVIVRKNIDESMESNLLVIGALENLILIERERLKTLFDKKLSLDDDRKKDA